MAGPDEQEDRAGGSKNIKDKIQKMGKYSVENNMEQHMKVLMKRVTESLRMMNYRTRNGPMGLYSHLPGKR